MHVIAVKSKSAFGKIFRWDSSINGRKIYIELWGWFCLIIPPFQKKKKKKNLFNFIVGFYCHLVIWWEANSGLHQFGTRAYKTTKKKKCVERASWRVVQSRTDMDWLGVRTWDNLMYLTESGIAAFLWCSKDANQSFKHSFHLPAT